ncbi:hypothetical protein RB608_11845 [Nocardioides sp. LHD-245]|uniref:hypothetical protein n=1 Tax=Nocardioides sp. LHD-245 TaxID=3051387 RepID=UPI0027DF43F2|nr:hypothetical protein [Nocardioides sp. LHD-245]
MTRIYLGVDPGPVPGIVVLRVDGGTPAAHALQCSAGIAAAVVDHLVSDSIEAAGDPARVVLAVEKFVVGRASMRSGRDGALTRDLVGQLQRVAALHGVRYVERSASQVKPWATDDRLAGARLLEPTKGMRHARDAARLALYAAVHDGALPDPLSRRAAR